MTSNEQKKKRKSLQRSSNTGVTLRRYITKARIKLGVKKSFPLLGLDLSFKAIADVAATAHCREVIFNFTRKQRGNSAKGMAGMELKSISGLAQIAFFA